MKKRVLSVLLLLAVLLSLFPFGSVSAAPAEHEHAHSHIAAAPTKGGPNLKAWDVKGGKIYYDPATDTIVSADPTVTEVYIPQEVADLRIPRFIGDGAFKNCASLTKVTLPGCVEGIGQQAFYGCDKLRELEYQGNFDVISKVLRFNEGTKTFFGSDNKPLTNLTVYAGRGSRLESEFPFTSGGIKVDLRQPGTPISKHSYFVSGTIYINEATREIVASSSDLSLTSGRIPDKLGGVQLESIGSYAFSCADLRGTGGIQIGDRIKHIRSRAFYGCRMGAITFPYYLESIDPSAVEGCYNLANFGMGAGVGYTSGKNFTVPSDCHALYKRETETQGWTLVLCPPKLSTINVYPLTEVIGTGAFAYNDTLTEINLPAELKSIGNHALHNPYSKIKTIKIPEGVTTIGYRAFPYAEEVYFYGDAPTFNQDAFNTENRTTLYYIEGKQGWNTPRYGNYTSIYGALQTYPTYPWCEQSNPPGHTIEKVAGKAPTCTEDGYAEHWRCKTCSKLFSDASGTQQISTPRVRTATGHKWTWTIDKEATPTEAGSKHQKCDRCGATRYENTVIPKTHGNSVVAYEVENGNIYFDTATGTVVAADKTVTGADIPEYIYGTRVVAIGDNAFNSLSNLKRVTLPDGLKKIGKRAFAWCSITTIVIPASVTEIGDAAFVTYGDSDALRSIYFLGDAPQFGDAAFYSDYDMDGFMMNEDRTLYFMEGKARWTTPKYGNYSDQDGVQEYPTQLWTHEHTLTHVPAVKAECEKDGNEEYWKCSQCYAVFADAEGSEQLDEIPVIPALGHDYQRKADDLHRDGSAKYHLECTRCGKRGASGTVAAHTHFFPPAQITPRKSATCTKSGVYATCKCNICELTFYCKEFDKWIYLSQPTDVIIKALGHDIVKVEYAAPTCTEDGSREHWRCKRCGNTFADAAGTTPYNGETVIPAFGHKWFWVTDTEATETAVGVKHEECFNCGEKRNEGTEIPMRAHTHSEMSEGGTLVALPAKDPTCTEDGWQAYWECNTCHKKYADPKGSTEIAAPIVIPAVGHVLTHYEKEEATCTKPGWKERWVCDRCSKSFADASATTELDTIENPPHRQHTH